MKTSEKICHKIILKNAKEKQTYTKRQIYVEGTPKLILGKCQNNVQEIWIDDLKNQSINRLKELNSSQKAFGYGRTIIIACLKLAARYGNFIINENMIFFNQQREIFAWINPQILENHVKIYLPHTPEGELAMIRSIITYFKLWLKCDYNNLNQVKTLDELLMRFQTLKSKVCDFKPLSPGREFLNQRKNSIALQNQELGKFGQESLLSDNKSNREVALNKSPGKEGEANLTMNKSLSNKYNNPMKFNYMSHDNADKDPMKNKTTQSRNTDQISEKNAQDQQFQHKTFNNLNQANNKLTVNKSLGIKNGNNYFPNKTTSNRNPIVDFICKQDENPLEYGKNKILLEEDKMKDLERDKLRRMKESLDGIGEELNDLFVSNIENEDQNQEEIKKIEEQFENLLS